MVNPAFKGTQEYYTIQQELQAAKSRLQGGRAAENSTTDQLSRLDNQKANSARPAYAELTYISTGTGQQRIAKPLIFPVIFRSEPHFTSGSAVLRNPDAKTWHDPIGTCGVYAWQRNSRGHYLGAFIWVRVDCYPVRADLTQAPPQDMRTQHFMTFSAKAYKEIGDLEKTIADLKARVPGIT